MENIPNLREQDKPHPLDAVARTAEGVAMPTREEIAAWMREAEAALRDYEILLQDNGRRFASHEIQCVHEDFAVRAAQVEAMRCETCAKNFNVVSYPQVKTIIACRWSGCGGCFHYEERK